MPQPQTLPTFPTGWAGADLPLAQFPDPAWSQAGDIRPCCMAWWNHATMARLCGQTLRDPHPQFWFWKTASCIPHTLFPTWWVGIPSFLIYYSLVVWRWRFSALLDRTIPRLNLFPLPATMPSNHHPCGGVVERRPCPMPAVPLPPGQTCSMPQAFFSLSCPRQTVPNLPRWLTPGCSSCRNYCHAYTLPGMRCHPCHLLPACLLLSLLWKSGATMPPFFFLRGRNTAEGEWKITGNAQVSGGPCYHETDKFYYPSGLTVVVTFFNCGRRRDLPTTHRQTPSSSFYLPGPAPISWAGLVTCHLTHLGFLPQAW